MLQTQRTRHLSDTSHFKSPLLALGLPPPMRPRNFKSLQRVYSFPLTDLNLEILAYSFFTRPKLKLTSTNCYKLVINLKVLSIFIPILIVKPFVILRVEPYRRTSLFKVLGKESCMHAETLSFLKPG